MQTSISKRLLAGLLSIVMVLSLFIATPAKTEAADNEVLSITMKDFNGATKVADMKVATVVMGAATDITCYYAGVAVNNGSYDLDPDDKVGNATREITITLLPADISVLSNIKTTQVKLGKMASNKTLGWEKAEFSTVGRYFIVKVKTTRYDGTVNPGDIAGLKTPIYYQYYFPTEITGYQNVYFTLGALTWKYTEDGGAHFTYPTYPILNSAPKGDALRWYAVETVISAVPGLVLDQDAANAYFNYSAADVANDIADELAYYDALVAANGAAAVAAIYGTRAEYEAECTAYYNAKLEKITKQLAGRKFTMSGISADKKSAILTIEFIYPDTTDKFKDPAMTSIELTREVNFGTNDVNLPADVTAKMPTSFYVTVNGERKEVKSTLLANGLANWVVYTVSGGSLVKMDANEKFVRSNTWDVSGNGAVYYYAVLEVNDKFVNRYTLTEDAYLPVRADLFYASIADGHDLLANYDEYVANRYAAVGVGADAGWIIRFTVNDARMYGNTATEVAALKTIDAPTVNFYGYQNNYTAYAFGQGTTHFQMKPEGGVWSADNATQVCPTDKGAVYMAYVDGTANFSVESPIVFTYFDVTANTTAEIKTGALSIAMGDPLPGNTVFYNIDGMAASMDLANAIDTTQAAIDEIVVNWEGLTVSGDNYGDEEFDFFDEVTAWMTIPVKEGYKLAFTPEVKINGVVADNVELVESNGKTYIYVDKTFTLEQYGYIGKSVRFEQLGYPNGEYCFKQPFTNIKVPYANASVQRTLELSGSTQQYAYEFEDIVWYENGVEFEGATFTEGKRYTAVVTIAQPYILNDVATLSVLQGNVMKYTTAGAYITQAKAVASKGQVIITFEFGECKPAQIQAVGDIIINVPNGMTDDITAANNFYQYVEDHLYATLFYVGGATGAAKVYAFGLNGAFAAGTAAGLKTAMGIKYPGVLNYNPKLTTAQSFEFDAFLGYNTGAVFPKDVNVTYAFKVFINVEGTKTGLTFDANGGVYLGKGCTIEQGKPYGFTYDPAEIYREGYFFAGWFTAPEGGTRIYAKTIADGKITKVYAHWVKVFTGKVWTISAKSYATGRLTVKATGVKTKVDGYEFSISRDGINWTTVSQSGNTKYFAGLNKGEYQVRVRAYRRDSAGKLVYGAYSSTVKGIVK